MGTEFQRVATMDIPSEELQQSNEQHLQIISVKPIDEKQPDKKIDRNIKWYYKFNDVQKFEYARKFQRKRASVNGAEETPDNEFANMWLEKTILVTYYALPGILRWFEVISHTSVRTHSLSLFSSL